MALAPLILQGILSQLRAEAIRLKAKVLYPAHRKLKSVLSFTKEQIYSKGSGFYSERNTLNPQKPQDPDLLATTCIYWQRPESIVNGHLLLVLLAIEG